MSAERIRQARELAGFTQFDLSERIGITQPVIAQIEAGHYPPSAAVEQAISLHTGFDLTFLRRPEPPIEFPSGSILYRSQTKVSAKDKARAHRLAQLAFEITTGLKTKLKAIPVLISRLCEHSPSEAASLTRSAIGLSPDTPIKNITAAIERAGVLVMRLPIEVEGLDGFSMWAGKNSEVPVICLVGRTAGYRSRNTISEELGHLAMHSPMRVPLGEVEEEAKSFAGEFVLPEEPMRNEMKPPVTLASLAPLRPKWGASIQFLIVRSKELGIITPNQYRYLMQQVSVLGWRTKKEEPGDDTVPQEQPRAIQRMIEVLYGADLRRIRKETGIPIGLLRSLFPFAEPAEKAPSSVFVMNQK